jgi:hypothetical protein
VGERVEAALTEEPEQSSFAPILPRLERLAMDPRRAGGTLTRLLAPWFRLTGYAPVLESEHLEALLGALGGALDDANLPRLLKRAFRELEDNVTRAERVSAAEGAVPMGHAAWLHEVGRILERVERDHERGVRALAVPGPEWLSPPLRLRQDGSKAQPSANGARDGDAVGPEDDTRRLLELQLAAIDHVIAAARSEQDFLERRRRLLEGARRLLLDASAAMPLDPVLLRRREDLVAREIARVDTLQAAGLSPTVAVTQQARSALRRGDRERLHAALVAVESFARTSGDSARLESALAARSELGGESASSGDLDARLEAELGVEVCEKIASSVRDAKRHYEQERGVMNDDARELGFLASEYLGPKLLPALKHALGTTDGFFEVGASLSPVRAREVETYARLVRYPTSDMLLVLARDPADLQHAVIDDPRTVLLDLAAGRLLARRFVEEETRTVTRTRLIGEVRVYLLDGSTSMLNEGKGRATMRDAILTSELATTLRRMTEHERSTRLSLYYAYFSKHLSPITRVASAEQALAAIGDVVGRVRKGGTDIQGALEGAFAILREARKNDPDLSRASIVLVTDGNSHIDAEQLRRAREGIDGVQIGVSVIALGEENPVLRDLVSAQRRRGERAFYHFLDDARLELICDGKLDVTEALALRAPEVELEAHRDALEGVLSELAQLDAARSRERRGAGLPESPFGERALGPLALEDAALRDAGAVQRSFVRWFPEPLRTTEQSTTAPRQGSSVAPPDAIAAQLDAVRVVLATIAEVVGELGGSEMHRRADAIEILERLLPDARLTPGQYAEVVARAAPDLREHLAAVHFAARGGSAWFDQRLATRAKAGSGPKQAERSQSRGARARRG